MKKRNSRKTAVIAMSVVTALTMTACSMIPSAKASYISMDAAQSKALNAANVDAANVESYSAQMGDVGTTTCYEVQFVSDGYTYYYAVNATDGEIVKVTKTPVGEEPIQAQRSRQRMRRRLRLEKQPFRPAEISRSLHSLRKQRLPQQQETRTTPQQQSRPPDRLQPRLPQTDRSHWSRRKKRR